MSDSGVTRVDLHVKILDDDVVTRAKARGIDVLVYAPHFTHVSTIRERAARHTDDDLLVVPAREYFTGPWNDRRHVLAIDPADPLPDFIGFGDTMAELDRMDAAVLAPHPEFLTLSMSGADVRTYRDVVDTVEVYNPKHWPWHNRRAREIAAEVDLPTFASSYAHLPGTVGEVWVEYDEPIASAEDLVDLLRRGVQPRKLRRDGATHALKCRAEFCHLGWENTWEKFERVVLNGTEPTNPSHPDYDGEFADRSAY